MQDLYGDCVGYLLVVNDKIRVTLVVVENDINLGVHPVVHTGVIKVTGGVPGIDGGRPAHGGVSYGVPEGTKQTKTEKTLAVLQEPCKNQRKKRRQ